MITEKKDGREAKTERKKDKKRGVIAFVTVSKERKEWKFEGRSVRFHPSQSLVETRGRDGNH